MNRFQVLLATGLFIMICAAAATAQSDVMCFCVDDESASTCGGNVDVPAFGQQTIYFCVIDPSQSMVVAWEAYIEVVGEENMSGTWTVLGENAINFGSGTEFLVGSGQSPLLPNGANVIPLLSLTVLTFNEDPIRFYLHPLPDSVELPDVPGYASAATMSHPCNPCGAEDFPAFSINGALEDEARAWGEVKSIYGN